MSDQLQNFRDSLRAQAPPPEQPALLKSVWYGMKGDWTRAHEIAQEQSGEHAAWIHAWLHRIEGDLANARYWYRHAGRDPQTGDTASEGETIAAELLR